jgi:DNA-binding NarL/FixJ family response regulator
MKPRILIVDDHEIVRAGIRTLLGTSRPDWKICGEAANGSEAIDAAQALKPDVLILDITMPVLSGLEACSRITKLGLPCRILIFTMHDSEHLASEVRQAGAQGYVLKSQAARDLVSAVESILGGGTFFGTPSPVAPRQKDQASPKAMLYEALGDASV